MILSLFLLLATPAFADSAEVDRLFRDFDRPDVPGATVLVSHAGGTALARAYGSADLEGGAPTTTATRFRLASVSKAFTALAVIQLVEAGAISLQTPLGEILPGIPYAGKIQIRHLLQHTSGLKDYEGLIPSVQSAQVSDDDVLRLLATAGDTDFTPGTRWSYSNSGFVLLGLVVRALSGLTFPDYLRRHVFDPLGMKGTVAHVEGVSIVENRAYGHSYRDGRWTRTDQSVTSATLGDGGIYASVEEMAAWDRAWYGGTAALSDWAIATMTAPGTLADGTSTGYGMGWKLDTYRGLKRLQHTGSSIGFRTVIQRYTERRLSVIVLVNRAEAEPSKLAERVTDLYL